MKNFVRVMIISPGDTKIPQPHNLQLPIRFIIFDSLDQLGRVMQKVYRMMSLVAGPSDIAMGIKRNRKLEELREGRRADYFPPLNRKFRKGD
jgi:hypothetical protein